MIYIVDSKTGDTIAELMGDAKSIAERLMGERKRQGLDVSVVPHRSGYVVAQKGLNGRIEPLLEVKTKPPMSLGRLIFKYSIISVLCALSVLISLAMHFIARGMNDSFDDTSIYDVIDLLNDYLALFNRFGFLFGLVFDHSLNSALHGFNDLQWVIVSNHKLAAASFWVAANQTEHHSRRE